MKLRSAAAVLLLAAAAAGMLWIQPFYKQCEEISGEAVRLHVVASSDSEEDQAVKLIVRDAVLNETKDIFAGCTDKKQALAGLAASLGRVESAANRILSENGFSYTARAYVCDMYFDTITYGDATMPSGVYTALRVELGDASGHNWWCVMYPPLCVMASDGGEREVLEQAFTGEQAEIILGGQKYALRFKIVELWEQLLQWFK